MPASTTPHPGSAGYSLGATAYWTAAARGLESRRPDALLHDPWATALAGDIGAAWLEARSPGSTLPMVLRTRYFDDFLLQAAGVGLRQFVLLAAGFDTRAYRLAWSTGTHCFELDRAEVLAHKEEVLEQAGAAAMCERHVVTADLTEPWLPKLIAAGFEPAAPACWLLEGFLFYLPSHAIETILDTVAVNAATGGRLGFDVINSAMLTSPVTRPWLEMQANAGAPWVGILDDPVGFLGERGWQARVTQAGQLDANHGRWTLPVYPVDLPGVPHNWFVTALKK